MEIRGWDLLPFGILLKWEEKKAGYLNEKQIE